jgi:hypothetical protein
MDISSKNKDARTTEKIQGITEGMQGSTEVFKKEPNGCK